MQETVYSQRVQPHRLPADAPNILIVLIDVAGSGLRLAYGGDVRTDTLAGIHGQAIGFTFPHDGDVLAASGVAADSSPSPPHLAGSDRGVRE
jgi:hypothetical protein